MSYPFARSPRSRSLARPRSFASSRSISHVHATEDSRRETQRVVAVATFPRPCFRRPTRCPRKTRSLSRRCRTCLAGGQGYSVVGVAYRVYSFARAAGDSQGTRAGAPFTRGCADSVVFLIHPPRVGDVYSCCVRKLDGTFFLAISCFRLSRVNWNLCCLDDEVIIQVIYNNYVDR